MQMKQKSPRAYLFLNSKWMIFLLVAVAQFMVVLDTSIVNVALPQIGTALHFASESSLQWVVTAYALAFGGFLLLGGRAADLYGRRRMLMLGIAGFTACSLLIGMAPNAVFLIVLRSLQGLAAAFMSPAALSIVLTTFKEGEQRNRALAYWSIVSTAGAAAGLILGGLLTQYFGWEWNFFVNVPVGIAVLLAMVRFVPVHEQEESDKTLDMSGAILVTGGLISLVFALSNAQSAGWLSVGTIGVLVLSVVLLGAFIWNESRAAHPLMPLGIFRIRNLTGSNIMMTFLTASMLGMFFLLSLYMQKVLGFSPLEAGLAFLPFPIVLGLVAMRMPDLVARWGYRPFLLIGPVIAGLGMLWLTRLPVDGQYVLDLLPTFILMPLGFGMAFMPLFATATSGVPGHEAGLASGIINASQQMGGAIGLAILSSVAAFATQSANAGTDVAALVLGFQHAFIVSSLFILLALLCAIFVIRPQRNSHSHVATAMLH